MPKTMEKHKGLPGPDSFEGQPHLDLPPECWPPMYASPGQPLWLDYYPRGEFQSHQSQQPLLPQLLSGPRFPRIRPMAGYPLGSVMVSRVGFGAMQLPGPGVFGPPRDRSAALAVLRRAVELGVDHIDTAQFYGPDVANELIRAALHPYPDNLALVSKVSARRDVSGSWLRADNPVQLRQGIEENLRSLGVERLAAVNLRLMEDARPDQRFDDQLAAMIKARDDGLIGGVGLSNVAREHLLHAFDRTDIACVQNPLTLADRTSMPVLEECHARGTAFVPFFPLGSAFARSNPVLGNPAVLRTARRLGYTPAQIALAWLLSLRPNVLLIPGTSSVRHLEENIAVRGIELDQQAQDELAAAA